LAIDPRQLALDPSFESDPARGIALDPSRLTAEAVRRRFQTAGPWTAALKADERAGPVASGAAVPAAVLIALLHRQDGLDGNGLNVLLTHRALHLPTHAGQVSFPGGRIDDGDRGPVDAALREAEEEIGLPAGRIEVLGTLPTYLTITHFEVTPVVGLVAAPVALQLARDEVQDAFEVPLSFLMDPANHQRRMVQTAEPPRFVYAMPFQDGARERFIWGVTAAILRNFYDFLRG
jgi:8-oxo-dGTP pyrophosphatase MutT (NUDIX family)